MSKSRVIRSDLYEEDGSEIRRGPWTLEEDDLLIQYVTCHGEGRWNSSAKCAGLKRTGKSCRLRWLNYLKPDIKRGNLTPREQLLILELHSEWGNRWSKIAQHLPGRTDNEIKNYWRTRVQKQARKLKVDSNSKKFVEAIRKFWKPRLLEKIKQESLDIQTVSPSSSISSFETQVFTTLSPVLARGLQHSQHPKPNNLVKHGDFAEDLRTGIQLAGAYSVFENDDCYYVDLPSYAMMPGMDSHSEYASFPERHSEGVDWFGEELGKSAFW